MTYTDPDSPQYEYEWQNPNQNTFDFGRVFGRAFTGVFANIKPLAIAIAIVLSITILLSILTTQQIQGLMGDGSSADVVAASQTPAYWGWTSVASVPAIFFTLWVQLVVVQTSYSAFAKSPQPPAPLKTALRFLLPMFVVAVIYTIVCIFGFYLLFIGFVFAWPGWALAGPILVHEKKGIFESLGEAWTLSKGSKRWIFLLLFLLLIISFIIYSIALGLGIAFTGINAFSGDTAATFNMSIGQQVVMNTVYGITGYFVYALFASAVTAAYVEIKTMKGGAASVGEIFS